MNDDDFKLLKGFAIRQTDICDCRVAFATEKIQPTPQSLTNINNNIKPNYKLDKFV